MNKTRRIVVGTFLITALSLNAASALDISAQQKHSATHSERRFCERQLGGEIFVRTELFFGLSRSGGLDVTEEEFQSFIDTEVTPRFPDGLTLLSGSGQFKDASGTIVQEGSKLLILLYPFNKISNRAVETIRKEYKSDFQQESVLRVDERSCVSF